MCVSILCACYTSMFGSSVKHNLRCVYSTVEYVDNNQFGCCETLACLDFFRLYSGLQWLFSCKS